MEPLDALNEVAFRLENERASAFKAKAFRRAAGIVEAWNAEELAARLADGRLKSTKGIGDRTYEIIAQAASGRVPDYLADLRARAGEGIDPAGAELRALLRGDLHAHSDWSDGTTDIRSMADAALALGHEYLALTDHSPNLKIAHGLTAERLEQQLGVVAALNEAIAAGADAGGTDAGDTDAAATDAAPFRLLPGIEVDILEDGGLDQQPGLLDRLDVVVASVHSKLRSDRATMTRRMLAAVDDPHTDVLGHVTGRLVEGSRGTRPQSEFDAAAVFAACAANRVAVEINSRPERQDPPDDLIQMALDAGCLFSIDSDAHAPGHLAFLDLGAARAAAAGVPADRIVTTWPLDRLLDWTARNR